MTKRIVSGVFLLIALGALGLILAGALTSGEQLIVRFLTAIVVAALGLYVISDLRLQADDSAVAGAAARTPSMSTARRAGYDSLPPNSTAAFMATVTGKRSSTVATVDEAEGWAASGRTVVEAAPTSAAEAASTPSKTDSSPAASVGDATAAYAEDAVEAEQWPRTPDGKAVESSEDAQDVTDGLVAIFTKQSEQSEQERSSGDDIAEAEAEIEMPALAVNDHYRPPAPIPSGPTLTSIDGGAARSNTVAATGIEPTVAAAHRIDLTAEPPVDLGPPTLTPMPGLEAAAYARARVIDLRLDAGAREDIESAIRSGEIDVISSLIGDGVLSTEGPISDRDVRTMVFVAFTSNELRKILLAGGTIDTDPADLDLGPVEVFAPASALSSGLDRHAIAPLVAGAEATVPADPAIRADDGSDELDTNELVGEDDAADGVDDTSETGEASIADPGVDDPAADDPAVDELADDAAADDQAADDEATEVEASADDTSDDDGSDEGLGASSDGTGSTDAEASVSAS